MCIRDSTYGQTETLHELVATCFLGGTILRFSTIVYLMLSVAMCCASTVFRGYEAVEGGHK
eukprot:7721360-Pyramimonas_sp.AAC.1